MKPDILDDIDINDEENINCNKGDNSVNQQAPENVNEQNNNRHGDLFDELDIDDHEEDVIGNINLQNAIECAGILIQKEWEIKPEEEAPFKSVGYDGIKKFIENEKFNSNVKARALKVLEDLFYLNSPIEVIKKKEETNFLLRTTPSKNENKTIDLSPNLIIDLCHENVDEFIEKCEYLREYSKEVKDAVKSDVPWLICDRDYSFFGLKDIEDALSIIKRVNCTRIIKNEYVIADGFSILSKVNADNVGVAILSFLFHGRHNCTCNMSYEWNADLSKSLLPYHVFCYESLAYIRIDGDYLIETESEHNEETYFENVDEKKEIALFSLFDKSNPQAKTWSGSKSVKFLGMFKVDKELSMQERHWAFKKCHRDFIIIDSMV